MSVAKSRISFLAGAGLSMDAGLPSSIGLADCFKDKLLDAEQLNSEATNAELLEIFRFLNGGIRFQRGILNQDPDQSINIEELANAALRLKARMQNPVAAYVSGWHGRLIELEARNPKLLRVFTDAIYDRLGLWLKTPPLPKIAYLTRICEFTSIGYFVNLFTLNYDLLVESALRSRDMPIVNGMDATLGLWTPDVFNTDAPLRIFKLHGSLDWVEHENYGICSSEFPRHANAEDFEGEQRPLIIFGTDQKLTSKEPFLSLLYHFSAEIKRSDLIIIIGYSFADAHLNDILLQRMRENLRLKVLVVHPHPERILQNLPELISNPRVSHLCAKAKSAFDDGLIFEEAKRLLAVIEDEKPF